MTVLVYLDQTHLGRMTAAEFDTLRSWAEADRITVASSEIHTVETLKWSVARRGEMVARLSELRRGRVLLPTPNVIILEWAASRGMIGSVREKMITHQPEPGVIWDGALADSIELSSEHLDDEVGQQINDQVERSFGDVAGKLKELQQIPLGYVRDQLVQMLSLCAAELGFIPPDLPCTEVELALVLPSVGLQRYFYAHATVLEPNDIADLSFISRTVPHFDVVAVDRRMHDRLYALRGKIPASIAPVLFRSRIVKSVEQAIAEIRRHLEVPP